MTNKALLLGSPLPLWSAALPPGIQSCVLPVPPMRVCEQILIITNLTFALVRRVVWLMILLSKIVAPDPILMRAIYQPGVNSTLPESIRPPPATTASLTISIDASTRAVVVGIFCCLQVVS